MYFNQKNSLDRRERRLEIEATNISFSNRIAIKENCIYYVHAENSDWTCFEQSASLDVKSFFGFESAVEKLAVKQYAANLAKGKEILEFFIEDLIKGGVTYIPPFTDSHIEEEEQSSKSPADSAIDVSKNDDDTESRTSKDRKHSSSQTPTIRGSSVTVNTRRESTTSTTQGPSTSKVNGHLIRGPSIDDRKFFLLRIRSKFYVASCISSQDDCFFRFASKHSAKLCANSLFALYALVFCFEFKRSQDLSQVHPLCQRKIHFAELLKGRHVKLEIPVVKPSSNYFCGC